MPTQLTRKLFALFGLFFMTGGLVAVLTPNNSSNAPMIQLLGIMIGGLALLDLALRPAVARRPIDVYIPVGLVVLFAVMSILWAVDGPLATRRAGALVLTVLFGIWLAETFSARTIFSLILTAFALLFAACYVAILAYPDFGIHQTTNSVSETFIGAWKGVYAHKNDMGRTVALGTVALTVAALFRPRYRALYILLIIASLVLIFKSQSAQAIVLVCVGIAVAIVALYLRERTSAERAMALLFLIPFCVVVYGVSEIIVSEVLSALGKDPTLSARTEIWSVVLERLSNRLFLGGGYGTGWKMVADDILQRFGRRIGHAHNGYIQLAVQIGLVGAGLFYLVFISLTVRAFLQFMRGNSGEWACFWLTYAAFFFVGNMAASFSLEYNAISTVLFAMAPRLLLGTVQQPAHAARFNAGGAGLQGRVAAHGR